MLIKVISTLYPAHNGMGAWCCPTRTSKMWQAPARSAFSKQVLANSHENPKPYTSQEPLTSKKTYTSYVETLFPERTKIKGVRMLQVYIISKKISVLIWILVSPLDTPANTIMHSTNFNTGIDTNINAPTNTTNHVQIKSKKHTHQRTKESVFSLTNVPTYQYTNILIY